MSCPPCFCSASPCLCSPSPMLSATLRLQDAWQEETSKERTRATDKYCCLTSTVSATIRSEVFMNVISRCACWVVLNVYRCERECDSQCIRTYLAEIADCESLLESWLNHANDWYVGAREMSFQCCCNDHDDLGRLGQTSRRPWWLSLGE
eukprot:768477-Hanusia_phi.AAC.5